MSVKKIIAPVTIAGALLVGGIASTGTAFAATPATAGATASAAKSGHPLAAWLRAHRRQIVKAGVAISAKTIGVSSKDLVSELRSGKSVAQVAAEHGVSTTTVVNALVGAADAKVNSEVASHNLTAAQGATIEAALPAAIAKAVDKVR
jgi:hypothetical protein